MPVPKPLPKKASKGAKANRMGDVMHELKQGPHHKERSHKQEVAIAMKSAGTATKGKTKMKKSASMKKSDTKKMSAKPMKGMMPKNPMKGVGKGMKAMMPKEEMM